MKFTEFDFHPDLMEGIIANGFEEATPVQTQVIPHALQGKDILAAAQTGTGKTAAFLLPIINKLISEKHDEHISALIVVPTRELAVQIAQQLDGMAYFTPVSSIAVYGGGDGNRFSQEKRALEQGVDIVICTPGKMISHLNLGYVKIDRLQCLVLDEADRMLDMGFFDDIMQIIRHCPAERQNMLFSATMPPKIKELTKQILRNPVEVNIALSKPPEKIRQQAYVVYERQKNPLLKMLLRHIKPQSAIIFCSRKQEAKQLAADLKRSGFNAEEMHSDLEQSQREKVMAAFKNRQLNMLVATDIVSRGIDIEDIDLVVNCDVPNDGEDYVHRIGRTARAQADGRAITFISEKEQAKFSAIENLIGKTVEKAVVPAELGEVPAYEPGKKRSSGFSGKRPFKKR